MNCENPATYKGEPLRIGEPVIVRVGNEHHVSQARLAAKALADRLGLTKAEASCIVTSVSELGNNLVSHSNLGGVITLVAVTQDEKVGLEVICYDEGPGISDVNKAMQDGFSTAGGLGCGLPGVKRLMDEFEITSAEGIGTKITARRWRL